MYVNSGKGLKSSLTVSLSGLAKWYHGVELWNDVFDADLGAPKSELFWEFNGFAQLMVDLLPFFCALKVLSGHQETIIITQIPDKSDSHINS